MLDEAESYIAINQEVYGEVSGGAIRMALGLVGVLDPWSGEPFVSVAAVAFDRKTSSAQLTPMSSSYHRGGSHERDDENHSDGSSGHSRCFRLWMRQ